MSGSTFGDLFRVTNFGESHGPAIGCVIDGCPPGLALGVEDIQPELDRRRPGTSRHVTQRNEPDAVEILSGVYEGLSTGTPICLLIRNTDQRSKDYGNILDTFRPGHADYSYWRKYGLRDPRGGGRSSARLTAPMVAAGAVAKKWLRLQHGTVFTGWMSQLGEIAIPFEDAAQIPLNPFYSPNAGGINAVKGVELGDGFGVVPQRGSWHGDSLTPAGFASNHAGGVLGGISTGQDLVVSIAIKPTSSIRSPKASINRAGEPTLVETFGRHDPCVGIRAVPVAEAMMACVLADHMLRHRGQTGR